MDMKRLLEKMDQFAGQAVGQKPGDQVRGTEKATKKKSGEHPFKGRLVGASESILKDLDNQITEGSTERNLVEEYQRFSRNWCGICGQSPCNCTHLKESTGDIGSKIVDLCQKIYAQGDDAFDHVYHNAPLFAQFWDQYEGDIDSIVSEVSPKNLIRIYKELLPLAQEEGVAEAFIAPGLSAANAAAEFRRQGQAGGGYRGRVDMPVTSQEEYSQVGRALKRAAKLKGQHIEYGLSGLTMSVFSDTMDSDTLDEFIDMVLSDLQEGVAEASPETTLNLLKGLKSWQVVIMNNYYRGKYSDYSGRYYYVLASSPEEARQVVLDNADAILQDLLSMKSVNGKKILPRSSAIPITDKRIGDIKDGTEAGRMTTAGFKKMYGPQGPMMVKLSGGAVVDVQGQEQGVAEGSETAADIDKKIEFHKQGQAAAQYKGAMNKMHAAKIRELEAKKQALKQDVAEGHDNHEFHTSVEKGKFLPSRFGNKRYVYLHDLENQSPSTGGPQLVTVDDVGLAKKLADQYGGKVVKTKLDTFRIVKIAEQGVAEGINNDFEQAHHSEVEKYITTHGTPGEYRHKYDAMGRAHNSYLTYPGRTVTINTQQYGDRFGHNVFTKKEGVAEGNRGLSKRQETEFHAKLDKLVHNTFGKRKGEMAEEMVSPSVPTAGGPAGAGQQKQQNPEQAALLKKQQVSMQQNLANLKTAGVDIDPAKAAQSLQKTDTGAPMNAMDKDTISKLAPALGNVMSNPSTASQLNTLIKKAGGGA